MKKFITAVLIFLVSSTVYAESLNVRLGRVQRKTDSSPVKVERRMVARAEDVAHWMVSTARASGRGLSAQETIEAAEILVQLSRTEEGREVLTHPDRLKAILSENNIGGSLIVQTSIQAAQALQNPKLGGLSISEIIVMSTSMAIMHYPEAIGGELMLRGSTVKLAEAQQVVEALRGMIKKNPDALTRHFATVKMELIKDWSVQPELADVAVQVIGTNQDKIEIVIPSRVARERRTQGEMDSQIKEAIRYLQSRGRIDEANDLEASMQKEGAQLKLSDLAGKRGEATIASPLEIGIAIHFLENIHPDGAEFIKEMAAEERLGSMGLQQYIALIKKEMSHEWINIVNRNSLGHVTLGDINDQMKKYESDLMKYAELGGRKISITRLAQDYISVGDSEMPYDLVALMAQEPIHPQQLGIAFQARIPHLELTQFYAIETLAKFLPADIRKSMEEVSDAISMNFYEINGMTRDLEVFRVRASSVETLEESEGFLDDPRSFLVYVISHRPKAVVWLSQVTHPVHEGEARIVVDEAIRAALVEFSQIPMIQFDYTGRIDVLLPDINGVKKVKFDEQKAAEFGENGLEPIYVGNSQAELAALQEKAFMLPLYAGLRKKRATKFNTVTLSRIEEASKTVERVIEKKGITLDGIEYTVIPTQYEEIVIVSVSLLAYKALQAHQQNVEVDSNDGTEVYFFSEEGGFFRFAEDRNIFGQRFKRDMDVIGLQQKIYQGDAVIFAASEYFMDQPTAFELFGNDNHFAYRGGMVSFSDPYMTEAEKEKMLAVVDAIDEEMSITFGEKRPEGRKTWKFFSNVKVSEVANNTATLIYIPRGFTREEKHILEISADLARNPSLIKMRLRNMTIDQAVQEETVRDTSSLATGMLDSFDPSAKETTKDKVVKWAIYKFRNKVEGSSFKGMAIHKLSYKEGTAFLEKEFPEKIAIGLLADITKEIVQARGADKIRAILSETAK